MRIGASGGLAVGYAAGLSAVVYPACPNPHSLSLSHVGVPFASGTLHQARSANALALALPSRMRPECAPSFAP
jgi:hypothetical protein